MTGLAGVPVVIDSNGQLGTVSSSRHYKEEIQDMGDASSRFDAVATGHLPLQEGVR
jgi:hypothetical protein